MKHPSAYPAHPVLIVDDEDQSLRSIGMSLQMAGITHVQTCKDSRKVTGLLASRPFDVLLLDLAMPHVPGEEILLFGHVKGAFTVIATTNQDISGAASLEKFRKDLYYRLMIHHIHIPPLRKRHDDIPLLLTRFIRDAARALDRPPPGICGGSAGSAWPEI